MTRILVEKREPFRLDEKDMLHEIRDVLGVPGITGIRLFNGYDVKGVADIKRAVNCVFSEAGQDIVYEEKVDTSDATYLYTIASAIDQYDQREDYANQLLRIMEPNSKPEVRVFKQVALYGEISDSEYQKIRSYYINPLETRELPGAETKARLYSEPEKVGVLSGFIDSNDSVLKSLADEFGIAMALDNLKLCREYFKKEKRDPTVTEMKVLDTY